MNLDRELLFRFFNKETTLEEEKKIRLWIDECDEHRREFFRERQLFDAILLHGDPSYEKSRPRFYIPWHKVVATLSGIAAIVILTIITTTYFLQQSFRDEVMNTVTVPQGQRVHLTLSDGTKVWLNAKTKMEYPQSFKVSDQRIVKVDGEAYFEVAEDAAHPFIVETAGVKIKVLGTGFNVMAYPGDAESAVTLVHGKVGIQTDRQQLVLQPDEQYVYQSETHRGTVRQVDATQYISWKEGILNFDKMPLDELARKLSRWYDVEFFFTSEQLKQLKFSGAFKKYNDLHYVLNIIEELTDVQFAVNNRTVIVNRK